MVGQLRIISGKWARRRLKLAAAVDAGITRPTGDRVREALFSALGFEIDGARVLDLFAGSGALGLEALSRGAKSAVFCEKNASCTEQLAKNVQILGAQAECEIHSHDALTWLGRYGGVPFDVIFLDPPYDTNLTEEMWALIEQHLGLDGLVVLERQKKTTNVCPAAFEVVWERIYGNTRLLWMRKDKQ